MYHYITVIRNLLVLVAVVNVPKHRLKQSCNESIVTFTSLWPWISWLLSYLSCNSLSDHRLVNGVVLRPPFTTNNHHSTRTYVFVRAIVTRYSFYNNNICYNAFIRRTPGERIIIGVCQSDHDARRHTRLIVIAKSIYKKRTLIKFTKSILRQLTLRPALTVGRTTDPVYAYRTLGLRTIK